MAVLMEAKVRDARQVLRSNTLAYCCRRSQCQVHTPPSHAGPRSSARSRHWRRVAVCVRGVHAKPRARNQTTTVAVNSAPSFSLPANLTLPSPVPEGQGQGSHAAQRVELGDVISGVTAGAADEDASQHVHLAVTSLAPPAAGLSDCSHIFGPDLPPVVTYAGLPSSKASLTFWLLPLAAGADRPLSSLVPLPACLALPTHVRTRRRLLYQQWCYVLVRASLQH